MPSPAGAGLVLFPMVLWFQVGGDFLREPWVVAIFMLAGAGLLVSRIRTYSFKKVHIAQGWLLPAMLGVGLYLALLVGSPWMTLSLTMVAYVASIPFSFHAYRQLIRSNPETSKPPAANTSSQSPLE
jgi:CDP-diacylglycerol--serine O-phosphatidyltransferase